MKATAGVGRLGPDRKVARTPVGPLYGSAVTLLCPWAGPTNVLCWSGEMEWFVVVVTWIRSRAARQAAPAERHCTGCRTALAGTTDDELRASGGVLLQGAGWFCGERCERQYRLRFRIQPALTPSAGSPRTTPAPVPQSTTQDEEEAKAPSAQPAPPKRASAQDELTAALRARRMKYSSGV